MNHIQRKKICNTLDLLIKIFIAKFVQSNNKICSKFIWKIPSMLTHSNNEQPKISNPIFYTYFEILNIFAIFFNHLILTIVLELGNYICRNCLTFISAFMYGNVGRSAMVMRRGFPAPITSSNSARTFSITSG